MDLDKLALQCCRRQHVIVMTFDQGNENVTLLTVNAQAN